MARHEITRDWTVELDEDFQRTVGKDGDLMLWMPGRTVYASVYGTGGAAAEEAIERMLEGRPGIPVQAYDRDEPALAGHAYLLPECDGDHRYWGLNTWTATGGTVACVTFYIDDLEDLNWAIRAWRSVRHGPRVRAFVN